MRLFHYHLPLPIRLYLPQYERSLRLAQYGLQLINELLPSQVAYIPSLALRSAVYLGHVVGMGKPFLGGGRDRLWGIGG